MYGSTFFFPCLWILCNDYYSEERQWLQHAAMNIFCSSTTTRAGTIVESSCYFGRNEALEYRDIELYALRDSEYPGGVKLGMLVQLRLLKDRRNRGNLSVSQPRWINLTTDESSLDLRSNLPSAGTLQASVSSSHFGIRVQGQGLCQQVD